MIKVSKARMCLLVSPFLLLTTSLLLLGCAGGAAASNGPATSGNSSNGQQTAPESQRSIATAIALKAAESASNPTKATAPSGPRTLAEISNSAPTSGLLDNVHLAAGKGCDSCHGTMPADGKPAPVTTTKCLSCHGGSYDAIAAKSSNLGNRNPHKAHTGREDCDRCHHVHQPFEFSCNACHTFPIPQKYAPPASGQASSGQQSGSSSGEARHVETED